MLASKKIKLVFTDKYKEFVPDDRDQLFRLISRNYDISLSDAPDYLIYSQVGYRHMTYDCIKIEHIAENTAPDFNEADYSIGMHPIEFGDRYVRLPLFADSPEYFALKERVNPPSKEWLLNRKFCSYVVSNGSGDPIRRRFFEALSQYKKVDSGGRYMNNVGGPVPDKKAFCSQYKFNIAFENSVSPGYTTEKLIQPLSYFTLPIYFGNSSLEDDFYADCMVRVKDESDIDRAIEEIVYLDTHDEAYLHRVTAPCLVKPIGYYEEKVEAFLRHIFDQPLAEARRTMRYGHQAYERAYKHHLYSVYEQIRPIDRVVQKVRGCIAKKVI